jgi:DNA-binding NarL/FixJ family response regulator
MLSTLIVEDNAAHRQSLHQLLQRRFPALDIAEAEDGETALRRALSRRFDLIFMDIRLPRENGLDLTRIIKSVFDDSVICVLTSYDIFEYREAAFRNGADHFMVKGESTEAEIVGMVESLLRARYVSLIADRDSHSREQIKQLLNIHWPDMIVAEAENMDTGLSHIATLRPDLVLLELDIAGDKVSEMVQQFRAASGQATLIGLTDGVVRSCDALARACGTDYCVSMTPFGHTELVTIVNSLQARRKQH